MYIYIYICICKLIIYTKNHYAIKRFTRLFLLNYPSHLYFVGGEEIVFYKKTDNNIEKAIDSSI